MTRIEREEALGLSGGDFGSLSAGDVARGLISLYPESMCLTPEMSANKWPSASSSQLKRAIN